MSPTSYRAAPPRVDGPSIVMTGGLSIFFPILSKLGRLGEWKWMSPAKTSLFTCVFGKDFPIIDGFGTGNPRTNYKGRGIVWKNPFFRTYGAGGVLFLLDSSRYSPHAEYEYRQYARSNHQCHRWSDGTTHFRCPEKDGDDPFGKGVGDACKNDRCCR